MTYRPLLRLLRILVALICGTAPSFAQDLARTAAAPDDPALGAWVLPGMIFRVFHADGSSTNGLGVRDASWWCQSTTKTPRRYTIQFSQEVKFDMEFSPEASTLTLERWENDQWKRIPMRKVADLAALAGNSATPASGQPSPKAPVANQSVYVSGSCPGGTNFGQGGTVRTLYGRVSTDSELPFDVVVECYWVTWDGKNREAHRFATRTETISRARPVDFQQADTWGRTNGGSDGVVKQGYVGLERRGWVIAVRGSDGRKLNSVAANPDMLRLVQ